MLDAFVIRALIAGLLIVMITAPLGCFVIWRRMAYFGDALSHSALLGIALGFMINIPIQIGILGVCIVFAAAIYGLQQRKIISNDTLLGILAHSMLAYGLITIALMPSLNIDLHSLLFGDILSVRTRDLYLIASGALVILSLLVINWRKLLLMTLNEDLAKADGYSTRLLEAILLFCLTLSVALAIQIVGILLVTSLLIIPAATARLFAKGPESMAGFAALIGTLSVFGGLYASMLVDIPTGPAIVAFLATLFFVISIFGLIKISR